MAWSGKLWFGETRLVVFGFGVLRHGSPLVRQGVVVFGTQWQGESCRGAVLLGRATVW